MVKCGKCLQLILVVVFSLLYAVTDPVGAEVFSFSDSFEGKPGGQWSTSSTTQLGDTHVLGLFNDRNPNYQRRTILTLTGIPSDTPLVLTFDLCLVGTWDSSGDLRDRWTLSTESGEVLKDMDKFPNSYRDQQESVPVGNVGFVTVKNRNLAYWVIQVSVVIEPSCVTNGTLVLNFEGRLTGRSTELWGLDNVQVKVKQ